MKTYSGIDLHSSNNFLLIPSRGLVCLSMSFDNGGRNEKSGAQRVKSRPLSNLRQWPSSRRRNRYEQNGRKC